jgi:hypothetical protein
MMHSSCCDCIRHSKNLLLLCTLRLTALLCAERIGLEVDASVRDLIDRAFSACYTVLVFATSSSPSVLIACSRSTNFCTLPLAVSG